MAKQQRDEKGRFVKGNDVGKIEVDFKTVNRLAGIGCTGEEIALVLGIDYDTLNARVEEEFNEPFSEYIKRPLAVMKSSLRRRQYLTAMGERTTIEVIETTINKDGTQVITKTSKEVWLEKPSVSMQIWLGRNFLDQTDRIEFTGQISGHIPNVPDFDKLSIDQLATYIELSDKINGEQDTDSANARGFEPGQS